MLKTTGRGFGEVTLFTVLTRALIPLPHNDISLQRRYDQSYYKFGNIIRHSSHCSPKNTAVKV
jgi:hypothetical protein